MIKADISNHVIYAERVRLRPWQRRDTLAQELWPRYTEPFSSLWNIARTIYTDPQHRQNWSAQRYAWAIEDGYQRMIGRISLREIDLHEASARLGISLSPHYVSQGYGTEALAAFLDAFFGPLNYQTMHLDVAAFNIRAVRCYERLGFSYVFSEWRSAGRDASLRLLDDPRYQGYQAYFRRGRYETTVEFYEMTLGRETWCTRP
ncbi:GCN5-related N-acetyltransferase [Oscillochloris trichoides DG-6]|uniref:GCN5-related N-acetyltransferase n=1 Tax=Oscillochloris trichoides DG-6 TaxID=765420 RepID=E1IEB8_9CHLR|nr:GNAT family N-acetyltransferase [Oscillochloris trichoides]EFO80444.1 GCN5-related N-acetyltransferase [Oscillochloris trichoides DG-6]